MPKPALGRADEAESPNPRNDGPLMEGASSEAGALARVATGGAGGAAAACVDEDVGFDVRCTELSDEFAASGDSVAPHMPQKRFVV
jgi:hypothetical protein